MIQQCSLYVSNPKPVDVLRWVRRHLRERVWLHGREQSVDALGAACSPSSERAVRWSVLGAFNGATAHTWAEAELAYEASMLFVRGAGIATANRLQRAIEEWNAAPERTHEEVVAALDAAIALAAPAVLAGASTTRRDVAPMIQMDSGFRAWALLGKTQRPSDEAEPV